MSEFNRLTRAEWNDIIKDKLYLKQKEDLVVTYANLCQRLHADGQLALLPFALLKRLDQYRLPQDQYRLRGRKVVELANDLQHLSGEDLRRRVEYAFEDFFGWSIKPQLLKVLRLYYDVEVHDLTQERRLFEDCDIRPDREWREVRWPRDRLAPQGQNQGPAAAGSVGVDTTGQGDFAEMEVQERVLQDGQQTHIQAVDPGSGVGGAMTRSALKSDPPRAPPHPLTLGLEPTGYDSNRVPNSFVFPDTDGSQSQSTERNDLSMAEPEFRMEDWVHDDDENEEETD